MVGELNNDARIVRGTMPNGLSYYLVRNASVGGYADFTFIQKTGIAMEDSSSRGMTWLMECMALTETSNFPDGAIFTFIDNMGLDRTDGLVIDAGDYYTTYTFSDVPVKKNDFMVDSMLLAIYNMSSALIVDDRSVARGKNFFRNVFSAGETLEQRVKDSLARFYFSGTPLAPVPQEELFARIDRYTTEDVRRFYRNRCRPDMQALVIAGDIDPVAVESKIRSLFQVVSKPSSPAPEFPDSLVNAAGGGYFYFQDKEADCATVTFDYVVGPMDESLRGTAVPFIYDYLATIGMDIMQRRLYDAVGEAPFYARNVSAGIVPMLNSSSFRFSVECAPEDYVMAYEFILAEVERLIEYGVSGYEYRRSSSDYLKTLDETYRRRSSLDNKFYSDLCRANFTDGYVMTGIELDCKVSSQVLINIFEHNTPLHDGAVIIRGDRITSATCYLPLSDNMSISKDLGTRHRAALGMSEVCDALVIVVSEETGLVSVAMGGNLTRGVKREELREKLSQIQYRNTETKRRFTIRKGWRRK